MDTNTMNTDGSQTRMYETKKTNGYYTNNTTKADYVGSLENSKNTSEYHSKTVKRHSPSDCQVNLTFDPYSRGAIDTTYNFLESLARLPKENLELRSRLNVDLYGEAEGGSRVKFTFNPYDKTSSEMAFNFIQSFTEKEIATYV